MENFIFQLIPLLIALVSLFWKLGKIDAKIEQLERDYNNVKQTLFKLNHLLTDIQHKLIRIETKLEDNPGNKPENVAKEDLLKEV